jgi:hypothetical protein
MMTFTALMTGTLDSMTKGKKENEVLDAGRLGRSTRIRFSLGALLQHETSKIKSYMPLSHNQWPYASVIPCQDRNCNHHIMGIKGLAKLLSDEAPDVRSVQTSVFV